MRYEKYHFLNLFHDFIKFNLLNKHLIYTSHCYMFLGLNRDLKKQKQETKQASMLVLPEQTLLWEGKQREHTACTGTCAPGTACWMWARAPGKEAQVRCQEALSASSIHKIPYIPPESIKANFSFSKTYGGTVRSFENMSWIFGKEDSNRHPDWPYYKIPLSPTPPERWQC